MRSGMIGFLGAATNAPAEWTPADITPALWLDASDSSTLTIDGSGLVNSWADKSGNGRDFTRSGSLASPSFEPNGLNGGPCIFFGSGKSLTRLSGWSSSTSHSLFAVVEPVASGTDKYIMCSGISDNDADTSPLLFFAMRNNSGNVGYYDGSSWRGGAVATATPQALGWVLAPSAGTTYRDGSVIESGLSYSPNTIRADKWVSIGARVGFRNRWSDSRISEIVLIDGVISETDRQNLNVYFAAKWGTPLPT